MTWKDIPLRKYNDIYAINKTEYEDEIDRGIDLVTIIFDVDARNIPYGEFSNYLQQITKLPDIQNNEKPKAKYTLNGTEYWMTLDYGNITTAQYIDFQNYTKNDDLLGIVSTCLIPEGHSYNDGYDMKDLEELSIHDGMSITAFFFRLLRQIHDSYPSLFTPQAQEDDEEEENEQGRDKRPGEEYQDNGGTSHGILPYVLSYTKLTNETITTAFETSIMMLLYVVEYEVDRLEHERLEMMKRGLH